MRTREEQAKSLRDSLCADYVSAPVHEAGYELAMRHIEEAERRAEQRVRAEIGRDSERLDWLEKLPFADVGRLPNGWEIRINNVPHWDMHPTLRKAIDAAREVG